MQMGLTGEDSDLAGILGGFGLGMVVNIDLINKNLTLSKIKILARIRKRFNKAHKTL